MTIQEQTYRVGERGMTTARWEDGSCAKAECAWHQQTTDAKAKVLEGISDYGSCEPTKKNAFAAAKKIFEGLAEMPASGRLHAAQYAEAYVHNYANGKFGNDEVGAMAFLLKRGMEVADPNKRVSYNDGRSSGIQTLTKFDIPRDTVINMLDNYMIGK